MTQGRTSDSAFKAKKILPLPSRGCLYVQLRIFEAQPATPSRSVPHPQPPFDLLLAQPGLMFQTRQQHP